MSINPEKYAERSRKERLDLHRLVAGGMPVKEALKRVLPKSTNGNRKKTLERWTKYGVWPVPAAELTESDTTTLTADTSTEEKDVLEPAQQAIPQVVVSDTTPLTSDTPTRETQPPDSAVPEPVSKEIPPAVVSDTTTLASEDLLALVDQRIKEGIKSELAEKLARVSIPDQRTTVGGRGHTGRTHVKLTATIPEELMERLRQLGGTISWHVASAVELYLSFRETEDAG